MYREEKSGDEQEFICWCWLNVNGDWINTEEKKMVGTNSSVDPIKGSHSIS